MAQDFEVDPAQAIAVGAIGQPGQRAFFIQARGALRSLTLLVEKVQVAALAQRAVELLEGEDVGAKEAPAELREPVEPDWRAGQLGIGMDSDRHMVVLVAQEAPAAEDTDPDSLATARIWIRPAQMLALANRGLELVSAGRPLCPVCGQPMDPEGHHCPRRNGKSPVF
ncbi:MAG TPA: DUF3090 family protein [Candidatus Dormibacteraeota bacterium]|nr:DUF3090 family protein [Candidatus Dormibacteraeota bacterium]